MMAAVFLAYFLPPFAFMAGLVLPPALLALLLKGWKLW